MTGMSPLLNRRDRITVRSLAVCLFVAAVVVGVDLGIAWPVVLALVATSALGGGALTLAQLMVRTTEMGRLMSVALAEQAVRDRTKTVTRRLGWHFLKPGDRLTLVRKSMGRRRRDGAVEPLVRVAEVEVVSARRERLWDITDDDVTREGFPEWDKNEFVRFFCREMRIHPLDYVTRIEWRYL